MGTLHHRDGHHGWDRRLSPIAEVGSGDEVELVLADCFDGQLEPDARPEDVAALDLSRANPLTGPVHVAEARPGDVLAIELLEVSPGPFGWTAVIPGFGLLADDFPAPHVVASRIGSETTDFGNLAQLPTRPFLGTLGLAPDEDGPLSVIPPRRVGGNLDCREVQPGATLLLPVEVEGGLLSAGDAHATQGDGEVCGTAVETSATARLRVHVRHDLHLDAPHIELPVTRERARGPRHLTTGVGSDLYEGARNATRAMIAKLVATFGLAAEDAYALCSVVADLRIIEVVDAPNWVVGLELETSLLG